MLFRFNCSGDGIKDLPGGLLLLKGGGAGLSEGLKGLLIFILKHHFELFPAFMGGVFFLCVNVEGFQEVNSLGVETSPLVTLIGCAE